MPYTMMIWQSDVKVPSRGDLFKVIKISPDVLGARWGRNTHVKLEPCTGNEQLRAELANACAARDTLAKERDGLEASRQFFIGTAEGRDRNLTQAREELTQARAELAAVDEALSEFYCPALDPETDDLCGSFYKDHGVNVMRQALEMAEHVAAETGLEAEGLQRQLAVSEQRADGFYSVLLEVHKVLTDDLFASPPVSKRCWYKKQATPKALEEMCRLARAAQCDLSDILAYGSMDKVQEEKEALESVEIKLQAILRYARETLEVEQYAEAELDDGHKVLAAERQLRYEAEHELVMAEDLLKVIRQRAERAEALAATLAEVYATVPHLTPRRRAITDALFITLAEVYAMLNCSPEHPWSGCEAQEYSNEDHYMCHSQEARELLEKMLKDETPTNTQALAALVTPELVELLERVGTSRNWPPLTKDRHAARALAARIKEALGLDTWESLGRGYVDFPEPSQTYGADDED